MYALRGARRTPGFSLVVLLTLALGIGATTAMFSVVRGVLLRPLPFPQPERVVRLWPANRAASVDRGQISPTELEDWTRTLRGFTAVGGFRVLGNGYVVGDGPEPAYARTAHVSPGFFPALGTAAALGRTLTATEHVVGANHAVVVGASTSKKGRVKTSKRGVSVGGADLEVILTGLHGRVNTVRHLLGGEALVYGALVLNKIPKADVVVQNTIPIGSATAIFEYVTQQHMAAPPRNLKAIAYDLHGIFVEMETFGVA